MENKIKDNPLVAVTLRFRDGSGLRQVFTTPVPQVKAMAALGQMVAKLGGELKIELEPETEGLRKGIPWLPEEVQKLKELWPTHTSAQIAVLIGRSPKAVWSQAYHLCLRKCV